MLAPAGGCYGSAAAGPCGPVRSAISNVLGGRTAAAATLVGSDRGRGAGLVLAVEPRGDFSARDRCGRGRLVLRRHALGLCGRGIGHDDAVGLMVESAPDRPDPPVAA